MHHITVAWPAVDFTYQANQPALAGGFSFSLIAERFAACNAL
jgi:hypothetical protein